MPTVNFEKKEVLKLLGKKISDQILAENISYLGTDLKSMNDEEIIVEIFPNRPDMLSIEGFARALSAFMNIKPGLRKYKVKPSNKRVKVEQSVKNIRPYIKCAIVKNIEINSSQIKNLMQLQEKLHQTHGRDRRKVAIGVHDYDKIKFPLKYKAVEPSKISFIPLGETIEMNLKQILEVHPKGKKYAWILEDKQKYPIIIDAKGDVVSFPPIINGVITQVTEGTKNIFIDVTGENETAVEQALNIIVSSLAERGAEILSVKVNGKETPRLKSKVIKLNIKYASKILGIKLKEGDVKKMLARMGYSYNAGKATVPCYRTDILHQYDVIEDIVIAYGYNKIIPELPNISTTAEEDKMYNFNKKLALVLVGFGFLETNTVSLTSEANETKCGFREKLVLIKNSATQGYNALRKHIVPSLLNVFSENKHNSYPQRIFEIGTVFSEDIEQETMVKEESVLGIASAGTEEDFTKMKQIITSVLNNLNLKFSFEEISHEAFIEGRSAKIVAEGQEIGFFGEVAPLIIESLQLEIPIVVAEINTTKLFDIINSK
ncbi:MAG: phenylalanine--tRNA ligase subunit beta [Candidatus Woesearchaeota archaeon]